MRDPRCLPCRGTKALLRPSEEVAEVHQHLEHKVRAALVATKVAEDPQLQSH